MKVGTWVRVLPSTWSIHYGWNGRIGRVMGTSSRLIPEGICVLLQNDGHCATWHMGDNGEWRRYSITCKPDDLLVLSTPPDPPASRPSAGDWFRVVPSQWSIKHDWNGRLGYVVENCGSLGMCVWLQGDGQYTSTHSFSLYMSLESLMLLETT